MDVSTFIRGQMGGIACLLAGNYPVRTSLFYPGQQRTEVSMTLQGNDIELASFGEYLLKKSLVPERNAKFYVNWARRFLRIPQNPNLSLDDRIMAVKVFWGIRMSKRR